MQGEAPIIFPTLQTYKFELAYEYKQCCQLLSLNYLMVYWGKNAEKKHRNQMGNSKCAHFPLSEHHGISFQKFQVCIFFDQKTFGSFLMSIFPPS